MGSTTNQSMFEALFDRRLKPTSAFAEGLRAAGYDAAKAVPTYPTAVWTQCLELARRHHYSQLTVDAAYRHLGREFAEGFLETITGRLIAVALPFMSPASFLQRLGTYFRTGRNDDDLDLSVTTEGDQQCRAQLHNPAKVPGAFVAGIMDAGLSRLKVEWTIDVQQTNETDATLVIRWK